MKEMSAVNPRMLQLGQVRSVIRETFEYGLRRAQAIGRENVFDFSLGNPSVPAPSAVGEEIARLATEKDAVSLHGYTTAAGAPQVREAIAANINARFGTSIGVGDLYLTCGAAASLSAVLGALFLPGEELVVPAPFFPEYSVFAAQAGATLVPVACDPPKFHLPLDRMATLITPRTKAVLINTPNNPTGVQIPLSDLRALAALLTERSREYGHPIFLISDEPYRELVYEKGAELPYLTTLYDRTVVCYSYSKSLSLPGERIGYVCVSPTMPEHDEVYAAVCGAGRALGYVCAPSLMQHLLPACLGLTADRDVYRRNRDLLYQNLTEMGFECVYPDGAFYLFMKAPEPDAAAFCLRARDFELLLVPSESFGCTGYVRISYCVATETIERALPAFRSLAAAYGLDR